MTREKMRRVYRVSELGAAEKGREAMEHLAKLARNNHPEKNPLKRLHLFERYTDHLIDYVVMLLKLNRGLRASLMLETPNANLPWDSEEDEALVQFRAEGEPIHKIANSLGRTPAACATRLSTLTGIPRSQIVDAYIEGELDNQPVRGLFHGRAVAMRGKLP